MLPIVHRNRCPLSFTEMERKGGGMKKGIVQAGVLLVGLIVLLVGLARGPESQWVQIVLRIAVVVVSLLAWFRTQSMIGARTQEGGIGDTLHAWTEPWNDWLQARPQVANWILRISSGFIDLFAIFLLAAGILGGTLRPFIGLLMVFVFRQLCQGLCALPAPPKMIWRHPGFPSLLVTYGVSGDFFISGHTAVAVLGAIEVARVLPLWVAILAGIVAAGEAVMVIVLRAHYTMDVLGAVVAAWCAADIAMRLCVVLGI
jgi:membrane-associated phospholipid phosphatase